MSVFETFALIGLFIMWMKLDEMHDEIKELTEEVDQLEGHILTLIDDLTDQAQP